jgi:hypothetical protein
MLLCFGRKSRRRLNLSKAAQNGVNGVVEARYDVEHLALGRLPTIDV